LKGQDFSTLRADKRATPPITPAGVIALPKGEGCDTKAKSLCHRSASLFVALKRLTAEALARPWRGWRRQ